MKTKKNIVRISILVTIFTVLLSTYHIFAYKFDNPKGYIKCFNISSGGFAFTRKIPLYRLSDKKSLSLSDYQFYVTYRDNEVNTSVIKKTYQEYQMMTSEVTKDLPKYIALYEEYKTKHPNISAYSIFEFADQCLLRFEDNGKVYLIGQVYQFTLPKDQVMEVDKFFEALELFDQEYKKNCPALNCYGN